ncbi:MAG: DUF4430 domain-containing protein [Eubacteriales bacterium]|nr:DUF4430 domain-containing protein [Eubacteriales bacterium]MDD7393532.1 DUF4430 domain-containing protein [Eubacteriales bacterium]MDY3759956.1 DUF4430 domain-containing protein [Eubacteriales bacterium]
MLTAKKALSVLMALVICLGIVCACSPKTENTPSTTEQTTEIAKVTFVFAVTGKDGKVKEYTVSTSEKYLADALIAEGILNADEKASGLYTSIDGVVASWDDDNAWWMITKDGEMTSKGMNELPVSEGDRYEAVYTIGY